jgi:predicted nucleic acid-binding protein
VTRAYIDSSALFRAILRYEDDHDAAVALLDHPSVAFVASELLLVEADRTAIRLARENTGFADLPAAVAKALQRVTTLPIDRSVITAARAIPEAVKSLDAIHIATAEALGDAIGFVLTYDRTMAAVLHAHGIDALTASEALARLAEPDPTGQG